MATIITPPPVVPDGYGQYQPGPLSPPPKKNHTTRNVLLIVAGAGIIVGGMIGGIAAGASHTASPASTPALTATSQAVSPVASQPAAPASSAPASTPAPVTPAPAVTVPDAQSALIADGYTSDVVNESQATIASTFGSAAPYITSAADGNNGTDVEVVIVMTNDGVTTVGGSAALQSGLQNDFPNGTVTVTPNNDGSYTVRIVESVSAAAS